MHFPTDDDDDDDVDDNVDDTDDDNTIYIYNSNIIIA